MPEGGPCRCGRGTLYDVLQVSPWCEPEVIQAAFRALARTRHPDVNRSVDAEEQMRRLNGAYQVLSDPVQRARYDEELALEAARPALSRPSPGTGYAGHGGARVGPAAPASGAGARPGAAGGAGAATPAGGGPSATPAGAAAARGAATYRAAAFDARGEVALPRTTIYVAVVMAVVILVLVAMLLLEYLGSSGGLPSRSIRTPVGAIDGVRTVAVAAAPPAFRAAGPVPEPGLSSPRSR